MGLSGSKNVESNVEPILEEQKNDVNNRRTDVEDPSSTGPPTTSLDADVSVEDGPLDLSMVSAKSQMSRDKENEVPNDGGLPSPGAVDACLEVRLSPVSATIDRVVRMNSDESFVELEVIQELPKLVPRESSAEGSINLVADMSTEEADFRCLKIDVDCGQCGKKFATELEVFCHKPCYLNRTGGSLTCEKCGKKMGSWANLRKHMNCHYNQMYACNRCTHQTATLDGMEDHVVKQHTHNFVAKCVVCGEGFSSEAACRRHEHRHDIVEAIPCTFVGCGKVLNSKKSFRDHLKQHSLKRKTTEADAMSTNKMNRITSWVDQTVAMTAASDFVKPEELASDGETLASQSSIGVNSVSQVVSPQPVVLGMTGDGVHQFVRLVPMPIPITPKKDDSSPPQLYSYFSPTSFRFLGVRRNIQ